MEIRYTISRIGVMAKIADVSILTTLVKLLIKLIGGSSKVRIASG
jgi:hypothetical protein